MGAARGVWRRLYPRPSDTRPGTVSGPSVIDPRWPSRGAPGRRPWPGGGLSCPEPPRRRPCPEPPRSDGSRPQPSRPNRPRKAGGTSRSARKKDNCPVRPALACRRAALGCPGVGVGSCHGGSHDPSSYEPPAGPGSSTTKRWLGVTVDSDPEDSPSGLGRTLGKRVGGNPSRVRISHPPPP